MKSSLKSISQKLTDCLTTFAITSIHNFQNHSHHDTIHKKPPRIRRKNKPRRIDCQWCKIIDVRSVWEFQGGHLSNSVNIPLDKLRDNLSKLDKSQVIITCCASGMRSASVKSILKSNGFVEIHNGGGWTNLRKFEN
jgi:phage shock protein E